MAALLFYGHLPLQGCFPAAPPAPLVIQKRMTNRIVLEAPRRPASVISGAVFNHGESVQGQRHSSGPLSLDRRQRLVQSGLRARSCERDAGTPANLRRPRSQRRGD